MTSPLTSPVDLGRAFLLERFDEFLSLERGSSARTNEAYGRDLARLAAWAVTKGVREPGGLTPAHLREFVYHLKDLGLAPSSIRRGLSAVRTWYRFLLAEGVVEKDPSERIETPRKWRVLPEVLRRREAGRSETRWDQALSYPKAVSRSRNSAFRRPPVSLGNMTTSPPWATTACTVASISST